MKLTGFVRQYLTLTAYLFVASCSSFEQNDFIVSNVISNNTNEQIFYNVYQTGIDNYRFEFKSVNNSDTTKLFEYFLNDATYKAMRLRSFNTTDTLTIITNVPTLVKFGKTKMGMTVILKND